MDDELAAAMVPFAEALGADPGDVAWVPNVTFGLNLIARSLMGRLEPGDEVLLTDLEYGSQLMLWRWVCERSGAVLRLAPIAGTPPQEIADVIVGCASPATRVALVSHVTSASAQRLPVEDVGRRLRERGVVVVVDGAHAPGQIDLDLPSVGCDYYAGNLHKWFGTARSAGVLYAPGAEAQRGLDPLVVGWGGTDRAEPIARRVHLPGTVDPSVYLSAPTGLSFHREVLTPARPAARERLAAAAGALERLGWARVGGHEDDLLMAAFQPPAGVDPDRLEAALEAARVEAIVTAGAGGRLLRICVAWYTTDEDIDRLLDVVRAVAR